jgi:predicted alpha/beta superfamily hydrolase
LACFALAAATFAPEAAGEPRSGVISETPALQMATVQYVFHSSSTGRDYLIKVTRPFGPIPEGERRPVVYALDGGYEVVGPIAWLLGGAGGMRQAFVVSVGYQPNDYHWRAYDLAFRPYQDDADKVRVESGARAFRAFIDDELRPFIAAHFAADDGQAILLGHSEGALFAANILADRPSEFAGYVIASPSVWSDPSIVDRLRAGLPKAHGAKVFLAVGAGETPRMLSGAQALGTLLKASPTITVRSDVMPSATHLSYYPVMVAEALPWMLQ